MLWYQHVCYAEPAPPQMLWTRPQDGSQSTPQSHLIQLAVNRLQVHWAPAPALLGCLQKQHEGGKHRPKNWEEAANDRSIWSQIVAAETHHAEKRHTPSLQVKRQTRKKSAAAPTPVPGLSPFVRANCKRDGLSRVGLDRHNHCCNKNC